MKIAVISSTVLPSPTPGYGGLECVAYECAKGLAAKGHDVTLIATSGSQCPGGKVFPIGPPGRVDERFAYAGYSFQDENDKDEKGNPKHKRFNGYWPVLLEQDCIISHSWNKHEYLLKMEGTLKAPVLGVFHAPVNSMYQVWPPQCPGVGSGRVDKPCAVCISEDQASHLRALFQTDVRVCYNGADPEVYKPLDVPRSGRFLFLARYSRIKGAALAIEACLKAGVGLDLIGDTTITQEPEYFHHCMQLARQHSPDWDHKKGKQIRVQGGVSRGETTWHYSKSVALLHPVAEFREPFGLAPIESMLCGCPVAAWDNGACRETVKEGQSGWLIRSMDQLVDTVRRAAEGEAVAMRISSREWAKRFSLEAFVDRYETLCQEAIVEPW